MADIEPSTISNGTLVRAMIASLFSIWPVSVSVFFTLLRSGALGPMLIADRALSYRARNKRFA
jgi:hypothetical protein